MKETIQPKRKTKWVLRSSPLALKILLVIVTVLSILALVALRHVHLSIQAYTEEIREEAADLEYTNSELKKKVDDPNSAQNIADVARDELGLVDPNTIIIEPNTN